MNHRGMVCESALCCADLHKWLCVSWEEKPGFANGRASLPRPPPAPVAAQNLHKMSCENRGNHGVITMQRFRNLLVDDDFVCPFTFEPKQEVHP